MKGRVAVLAGVVVAIGGKIYLRVCHVAVFGNNIHLFADAVEDIDLDATGSEGPRLDPWRQVWLSRLFRQLHAVFRFIVADLRNRSLAPPVAVAALKFSHAYIKVCDLVHQTGHQGDPS